MFTVKGFRNGLLIPLVLATGLTMELTSIHPTAAQTQHSTNQSNFGGFFAPQGKPKPEHTKGGAARGGCTGTLSGLEQETDLITLVTPQNTLGLSAAARPAFFARIAPNQAKQVYFSLRNEDDSYFYDQTMTLTSSGVMKFEVPDDAPPLKVGEQYQWSVALICGNRLSPDSPWASSLMKRTDGSEVQTMAMTPMEQASAYGRAGLWYDTIESLFSMVEDQSSIDAQVALNDLLAVEGIDAEIVQP